METYSTCPVPKEQIPLEEFKRLSSSWFFMWPLNNRINIYVSLLKSWLLLIPVSFVIATGSITLKNKPILLIINVLVFSISMPILLLIRQLLGWKYIHSRLLSEKIEYEESGWYDGMFWDKPQDLKEKDLLIANHEVKPAIQIIKIAILKTTNLFILGLLICKVVQLHL